MTSFIELNVNFGDFALHYRLPPSDLLSVPRPFVQTRWSIDLDLIEILVDHYGAWRDSTPARSLACNPRRRLQNVLSRQLHDLALRGSRRSTVVMESKALIDRDGITGNTVSLTTESMVDSPLRNLPITHVMVSSPLLVAIVTARSARARLRANGSPSGRRSSCPCRYVLSAFML